MASFGVTTFRHSDNRTTLLKRTDVAPKGTPLDINAEAWEGQIYTIFYVEDTTDSCSSGDSSGVTSYGASLGLDEGYTLDLLKRKTCEGYRYWSYLF